MSVSESQLKGWHHLVPAFVVAGVAWWICDASIAPYLHREKQDRDAITELRGQIDAATAAIREIKTLESGAVSTRAQINRLEQETPGPSAVASFPDQLRKHFSQFGVVTSEVRLKTVVDVDGLPGFARGYWSLTLPFAKFDRHKSAGALLAVTEFEKQNPFVKVRDFAIQPDPEDSAGRIGTLNLTLLFRR